jgi:hypothetical protein
VSFFLILEFGFQRAAGRNTLQFLLSVKNIFLGTSRVEEKGAAREKE